ncbi:MAG: glutamate racemase [Muribaculaceae bacterium]|nr:glutamate racemase [Muribaculaceae bacterium]
MKQEMEHTPGKIGIFDSGYGGLTILNGIRGRLPQYDYLYLGDNARAPYGTRSFDIVFDFTRQAVEELFSRGCHLVILACNTASAKALRSIQQQVLPDRYPGRRVLGVIRPTVEAVGSISVSRHIGLLATPGTVRSHSYRMEIEKLYPEMKITETACPMWVPLIETGEAGNDGADYFVKKYIDTVMESDPEIDTLVLGCTHYPLLLPKIRRFAPEGVSIIAQGEIVGASLADYLRRHPEIDRLCTRGGDTEYLTTENAESFDSLASLFMHADIRSSRITL